jgi:hypothetical protein
MHTLSRIRERVVGRWARSDAAGTARRTQGETGFILIIAIVIMAALLILIAAVASSAVDTNASASRSASSNQALAAADAGAQVGLFRLDTDGATGSSGSSMAHGATYQYSVATYGSTGASGSTACTGFSVVNSSDPVEQGCITSVGTVNGVNAQVQLRIAGYTPQTSLFPVNGVFAVNGFSSTQMGSNQYYDLGSNGTIGLSNASLSGIHGNIEYLAGDFQQSQNSGQQCTGTCTPELLSSAITVPSVTASVYASAATTNNDASGITYSNADIASGNILTATNNGASVTFAPGTYYFCGINVGGFSNFAINTSGSSLVKIYIDSSYRSGSSCSSGAGNIYDAGNSTSAINGGGTSSNLALYFYGDPGCTTSCPAAISPMNAATINADVFAPNNSMTAGGAFTMTGALVVGAFTANNAFNFTYQAPSGNSSGGGSYTDYFPAAQTICTPSSTPQTGSC